MADPIFDAPSPDVKAGGSGALGKQMGPLPLWGWIAVLAASGGIIIMRRKKTAKATATATPDSVTYAQQAQQPTVGNMLNNPGAPIVTGGTPKPVTNDDWRSQAVTTLIAKGYSPLTIDTAMANYLAGQPLSTQQQALIDMALASLGVPPTPPPAAQMAPPTVTQPPEPPSPAQSQYVSAQYNGRSGAFSRAFLAKHGIDESTLIHGTKSKVIQGPISDADMATIYQADKVG